MASVIKEPFLKNSLDIVFTFRKRNFSYFILTKDYKIP